MGKRVLTKADAELIAKVKELGEAVTMYQLEEWRQFGLIPETVRHGQGQGPGMWSRYPEGAASQVVALIAQLRADRRLARAVFPLFVAGYGIREDRLRAAYLDAIDAFREVCLREARHIVSKRTGKPAGSLDSYEVAEALALELANRHGDGFTLMRHLLAKAASDSGESPRALLESVLTHTLYIALTGRLDTVGEEQLQEMVHASGVTFVDDVLSRATGTRGEESGPGLLRVLQALSMPSLRRTVRTAKVEDLERARDEFMSFGTLALTAAKSLSWLFLDQRKRLAKLARNEIDYSTVCLAFPAMLRFRAKMGNERTDALLNAARNALPQLRDAHELLASAGQEIDRRAVRCVFLSELGRELARSTGTESNQED